MPKPYGREHNDDDDTKLGKKCLHFLWLNKGNKHLIAQFNDECFPVVKHLVAQLNDWNIFLWLNKGNKHLIA